MLGWYVLLLRVEAWHPEISILPVVLPVWGQPNIVFFPRLPNPFSTFATCKHLLPTSESLLNIDTLPIKTFSLGRLPVGPQNLQPAPEAHRHLLRRHLAVLSVSGIKAVPSNITRIARSLACVGLNAK